MQQGPPRLFDPAPERSQSFLGRPGHQDALRHGMGGSGKQPLRGRVRLGRSVQRGRCAPDASAFMEYRREDSAAEDVRPHRFEGCPGASLDHGLLKGHIACRGSVVKTRHRGDAGISRAHEQPESSRRRCRYFDCRGRGDRTFQQCDALESVRDPEMIQGMHEDICITCGHGFRSGMGGPSRGQQQLCPDSSTFQRIADRARSGQGIGRALRTDAESSNWGGGRGHPYRGRISRCTFRSPARSRLNRRGRLVPCRWSWERPELERRQLVPRRKR